MTAITIATAPAAGSSIQRRKRAMDVCLAALMLVAATPLMVVLAVAVACDGGPVLFRQERVGLGGRRFTCLKLRTMRNGAEASLAELLVRDASAREQWSTRRKLHHDPRVTTMGRLLRATSLDELPQILNVLAGHMSLVGPRPVVADELTALYDGPSTQAYLSVRPGLTGLWQVSRCADTTYAERVALDCAYVRTLSIRNDVRLLVRTVGAVIGRAGAC